MNNTLQVQGITVWLAGPRCPSVCLFLVLFFCAFVCLFVSHTLKHIKTHSNVHKVGQIQHKRAVLKGKQTVRQTDSGRHMQTQIRAHTVICTVQKFLLPFTLFLVVFSFFFQILSLSLSAYKGIKTESFEIFVCCIFPLLIVRQAEQA